MGGCSLASRFGAILAPWVTNLGPTASYLPLLLFGSVSLVAGILALFLPETKGKGLPVTVREAEDLERPLGVH